MQLVRKVLYDILVYNKERGGLGYQAKFNFKWVPNLKNVTTPLGERVSDQTQGTGALKRFGIERTALTTLAFTGVVVGLSVAGSYHILTSLGRFVARTLE